MSAETIALIAAVIGSSGVTGVMTAFLSRQRGSNGQFSQLCKMQDKLEPGSEAHKAIEGAKQMIAKRAAGSAALGDPAQPIVWPILGMGFLTGILFIVLSTTMMHTANTQANKDFLFTMNTIGTFLAFGACVSFLVVTSFRWRARKSLDEARRLGASWGQRDPEA